MLHEEDGCSDEQASLLLAYTLRESPHWWLCSLWAESMHSLEHLYDLIEDTFYHFHPEHLDQKMLQQWKDPQESPMDFWQRFHDLQCQALKSEIKFLYLWDRFEYCLKKSSHPKKKFELTFRSVFFNEGTTQSQTDMVTLTNDSPSSPHQTTPPL